MSRNYKYHYRPEYGSEKLLIEFIQFSDRKSFKDDLFDAIKAIHPKNHTKIDLWMNDETIYTINSNLGTFEISIDNWENIFIQSKRNQNCIQEINNLLQKDSRFEKIDVDFNKYKK